MKINEKNILGILFVTIILIGIFGGMFRIRAVAQSNFFSTETDQAETEYRKEVKTLLNELGAKNAGVTMTKISTDGKTYEYKVCVNLPKYINFDSDREEKFLTELNKLSIGVDNATVDFSFS